MTIPEWMLLECSDHPAWPLMVREAIKYDMPKHYVRDLYFHDVNTLERLPRQYPFFWGQWLKENTVFTED